MKELIKNIAKEFNMNMIFVATFGSAIAAFYPLAEHIVHKQDFNLPITKETLILCIIASMGVIYKEAQTDKMKDFIKENKLSDIVNYFVKNLRSFKNIYEYLMTFKSIEFLSDTLSYTAILVPFMISITDIINNEIMSLDDIVGCGMSLGLGILSLSIKNIIKVIWSKFSKKINENNMEILKFEEFSLNEKKRQTKKTNLQDVEQVPGGIKYHNEIFPGVNIPKRYVGKGTHKYRVLAKDGSKVKPINFGDRIKKGEPTPSKLTKKYWESLPNWK